MSLPKFEIKNPQNREEKLIIELVDSLTDTTAVFMKLNNHNMIDLFFFKILRDSSIAYAGHLLKRLVLLMPVKKEVFQFLDECEDIFKSYTNDIREKLK